MKKICAICHQPFEGQSGARFCKRVHLTTCPICGKIREASRTQLSQIANGNHPTCSYACRVAKTQATSMERYGCKAPGNNPEARKKASETMMKTLGVPYAMMNDEVRKRGEQTLLEKYGVTNAGKAEEVIEKRKQTNKERYGDVMPFNRPECYEKQHQTIMERYGVMYASLLPQVQNKQGHISNINKDIANKLNSIGYDTSFEKYLDGKYFDIELIDDQILLEINPSYTHAAIEHYNLFAVPSTYHLYKTQLANEHGYQCIHLWDWDNVDIVINQLKPKQLIDASEFQVYKLTKEATDRFLIDNCIHGTRRGQMLSLGLVRDDEVYQIMTFGKSKRNKDYPIEMKRACTRIGYKILNGYDKLSKAASQEFGVESCIAYQDISKLSDINYEELGMKLLTTNPPRKIWSKGKKYICDYLVQNPQTDYAEDQLLQDGWLPVYDCGQAVYVTQ